jgi:hypothetical protein
MMLTCSFRVLPPCLGIVKARVPMNANWECSIGKIWVRNACGDESMTKIWMPDAAPKYTSGVRHVSDSRYDLQQAKTTTSDHQHILFI